MDRNSFSVHAEERRIRLPIVYRKNVVPNGLPSPFECTFSSSRLESRPVSSLQRSHCSCSFICTRNIYIYIGAECSRPCRGLALRESSIDRQIIKIIHIAAGDLLESLLPWQLKLISTWYTRNCIGCVHSILYVRRTI